VGEGECKGHVDSSAASRRQAIGRGGRANWFVLTVHNR
jgi:hypothetical protein